MLPVLFIKKSTSSLSDNMKDTVSSPLDHWSHPNMSLNQVNEFATDINNVTWSMDSIGNFLDIPMNVPVENEQPGAMVIGDDIKTDLQEWEWADQLIATGDDALTNLSDILIDVNVPDLDSKVCF